MAKELSMLERNEQGKLARKYFIECEERLVAVAPEQHQISVANWRKARIETRYYHKIMCDALALSRAKQGKDTNANHYTNEANMLYGLLLGTTAKKWMSSKGPLRLFSWLLTLFSLLLPCSVLFGFRFAYFGALKPLLAVPFPQRLSPGFLARFLALLS